MFVIQEVDEDTFSERSRADRSQVFSQGKDQSVVHGLQEHYLESLKEEQEEEDTVQVLLRHHQTLNAEDLSNLSASQDIDPHNASLGNAAKTVPRAKEPIKVEEEDQARDDKGA